LDLGFWSGRIAIAEGFLIETILKRVMKKMSTNNNINYLLFLASHFLEIYSKYNNLVRFANLF